MSGAGIGRDEPLGRFVFTVDADLPAQEAWCRLVDVGSHGAVVPLTKGSGPSPDAVAVGSRFVARTALGPVGFDDVMVVRALERGHSATFEKVGRVLGGVVEFEVTGSATSRSVVRWNQSIDLPWVPAACRGGARRVVGAVSPMIGRGYRSVVAALLT